MPISAADVKIILSAQDQASATVKQFGANAEKAMRQIDESALRVRASFDKLKENWLGFTAAFAGVAIAINKAWNLADMAAQYEEQKAGLDALAAEYGLTSDQIIRSVQDIVDGQLSLVASSQLASKAMLLGLNPDQIKQFVGYAERLTDVAGGDIPQAFDAMEKAVATGRTKGLASQFGLMVDLNKALEDYAAKHGIAKDQIDQTTVMQIRANAVMEEAKRKTDKLGEAQLSNADKMNKMRATIEDIELLMGQMAIRGGSALYGTLMGISAAAWTVVAALLKVAQGFVYLLSIVPGPYKKQWQEAYADIANAANAAWKTAVEQAQKGNDALKVAFSSKDDLRKARPRTTLNPDYEGLDSPGPKKEKDNSDKNSLQGTALMRLLIEMEELNQRKFDAIELEKKEAEQRAANLAAIDSEIAGLQSQATTFNMTATEARLYEMSLKGATAAQLQSAEAVLKDIEVKKQVAQVLEDIKTPLDEYQERIKVLDLLLSQGALSHDQYARGVVRAKETLEKDTDENVFSLERLGEGIEQWSSNSIDAVINFAQTGKGQFSEFVSSALADLAKLAAQEAKMGLIKLGISLVGSAIGSFNSGTVTGTAYNADVAANFTGGGLGFHRGGMPTEPTFIRVGINPRVFDFAPRYHGGIGPGETAAILREDEGVFTPGQMKALGLMARGEAKEKAPNPQNIRIVNVLDPGIVENWASSAAGERVIMNVIRRNQ